MKVQAIDTPKGERYLLLDNEYNIVAEVKDFIKFVDNKGEQNTTQQTYCYHLKLYYDYLDEIGITYQEIFIKDSLHKGPIKYLSEFMSWLQYPNYFKGIVQIEGESAIRSNKTVNLIMTTILKFYDYLSSNKDLEELDVYKELRENSRFRSFLSELHTIRIRKNKSILKMKVKNTKPKYITRDEFDVFYRYCTNERDKAIVSILFEGGLRRSEVIGLRISAIDFDQNIIHIIKNENDQLVNPDAHVKNNSEGYVYVPKYVMVNIRNYIVKYLTEKDINNDFLFVSLYGDTKGQPMTANNIEKIFERLSKNSGIKVTPHMLRHSYAVSRLSNGTYELIDIQKDLRHKQIQTTLIYADITDDAKKLKAQEYMERMNLDFSPDGINLDEIGGKLL